MSVKRNLFGLVLATCGLSLTVFALGHGTLRHDRLLANDVPQVGPSTELPLVVDGAKNPEKISDRLAYRHFFLALAIPANAPPEAVQRRGAVVGPIGLSHADIAALFVGLSGVSEQLSTIASQRAKLTAGPTANASELDALRTQEHAVVDDARARVAGTLTPRGAAWLESYVRTRVKSHIKIYGSETLQ
jgi:hypothetical protein